MQQIADKEALFRTWVDEHADMLYRYAVRRVGDESVCKDLVQETFLSAWRNMDNYRGETSLKNWLFMILKSRIIDQYRARSRKEELQGTDVFFDEEDHWRRDYYPNHWTVDLSDPLITKDFLRVFRSCGKKLKEVQHAVFTMKYVDGLESTEICEVLGISASNFWVLVHRAKVQLRACLEKNWIDK